MYEGSYRHSIAAVTGSYTKLTTEWNMASRILFIALLAIFDLKIYKLSLLIYTALIIPWLTEKVEKVKVLVTQLCPTLWPHGL